LDKVGMGRHLRSHIMTIMPAAPTGRSRALGATVFSRQMRFVHQPDEAILNLLRLRPAPVTRIQTMAKTAMNLGEEMTAASQIEQLERLARQRRWGLSLLLVGWLHLAAFSLCYYLTVGCTYHEPGAYLAIWVGELCGVALIFRLCGGPRSARSSPPLARFVIRVWLAYFVLAFNLGTMNTLRGHRMFELFPAMASLASFAFLVMTFAVNRRFFAAVLVMFAAGLLMSAYLLQAYLIFAVAWWLVLNGIGTGLMMKRGSSPNVYPELTAPALSGSGADGR
jgi:hypothetical protein